MNHHRFSGYFATADCRRKEAILRLLLLDDGPRAVRQSGGQSHPLDSRKPRRARTSDVLPNLPADKKEASAAPPLEGGWLNYSI